MKRIFLAVGLILLVCAAVAYLGTLRPFGPDSNALGAALTPETPSAKIARPSSTPQTLSSASDSLPTPTPAGRVALAQQATPSGTAAPHDAELTETAIPAQKTLNAIDARGRATWTPTAGPSPTPRPIDLTTNILLMGTDRRPNDPTWVPATDVIMVLFLDTTNQRAGLLSIPRDLVVAIPHHGGFRINYVYQYGLRSGGPGAGAELLKQVLRDEFSIRIDHWALIDFNGLQRIVDTLGGIDVQVACPLEDTIDEQHFVIPAGDVHMDYLTAKRYVQSRYSTSDTSRNFRQQRVMWAMAQKAFQLNALDKVPTLWSQLHDSIQTDMTLFDMVGLVPAAYNLDLKNHPERMHARVLDYPAVYPFVADYGAWLFMPNYSLVDQRLGQLFESPEIAQARAGTAECPAPQAAPVETIGITPTPPP